MLFISTSQLCANSLIKESVDDSLIKTANVPKNMLPYILGSTFIPGGGQIFMEHKTKGLTILGIQSILATSAFFDLNSSINRLKTSKNNYLELFTNDNTTTDNFYFGEYYSDNHLNYLEKSISIEEDIKEKEAMRNRLYFWMGGLQLYSALDCWQNFYVANKPKQISKSNPSKVLLYSFLLPGSGYLINKKYHKFGLFAMAMAGFGANIFYWNKAANFSSLLESEWISKVSNSKEALNTINTTLNNLNYTYTQLDEESKLLTGVELDSLNLIIDATKNDINTINGFISNYNSEITYGELQQTSRRTNKEKMLTNRNMNIWYAFLLYLYSNFDSLVDSHLIGFENKFKLSLTPKTDGLKLKASHSF